MLNMMSSSAWFGARIILRQVSPESPAIFDFILELHRTCSGNWRSLIGPNVSSEDLQRFLTYAATFLSNVGNYYVRHVAWVCKDTGNTDSRRALEIKSSSPVWMELSSRNWQTDPPYW